MRARIARGALITAFALGTAWQGGCSRRASVEPPAPESVKAGSLPSGSVSSRSTASPYRVRYDQVGYAAEDAERFGVVMSAGLPAPHYRIVDASTERVVAEGTAGPRSLAATSLAGGPLTGDRLEFGALPIGKYLVVLEDGSRAGPIVIGKKVYSSLWPLIGQFLAEQRCGPTTKAISRHGACHLFASTHAGHSGDGVPVDEGAQPPYRASKPVDVEGGWHDAGDYIKFVGTTAFVLAVELMALRDHREALGLDGDALAAELRWGLDWLLKMEAGAEPYHQVGGEGDHDPGWRLPEGDTEAPLEAYDRRPLFRMGKGRGRNLLGRSAAAFAFGSQVYARDSAYAARLLAAAKTTYAQAKARGGVQNPDPADFYEERSGDDDLVLGAAALARVTGDVHYANDAHAFGLKLSREPGTPVSWNSVDAVALLEAARAFPDDSKERTELAHKLEALAAPIVDTAEKPVGPGAPFGYALPSVGNGSVAESLGAAATCLAARRLGPNKMAACAVVARRQLHWLLGNNPFGVSFMVGAGQTSPQNVHHSFGQAAHVTIPGAIVGGPTALAEMRQSGLPPPPKDDPFAIWSTDDLLYEDKADNYICNEPAIDFAAPLVFTLAELSRD
jgi:endoglucanase